jgi:tetratricopeptide (TPR) repeat protein
MNKTSRLPGTLDRPTVLALITHALPLGQLSFAETLARNWLDTFNGDLAVELQLAQTLLKQDRIDEAVPVIKKIIYTDPEYLPAQRLIAYTDSLTPFGLLTTARQSIHALGGRIPEDSQPLTWGKALAEGLQAQRQGDAASAITLFGEVLSAEPDSALPAVLYLKALLAEAEPEQLLAASQPLAQRWPDALGCLLIYAHAMNQIGAEEQALMELHHAVSLDIGGQVPQRIWGSDHPYRELWPEQAEIVLSDPIPGAVAAAMGWNRLSAGEQIAPPSQKAVEPRRTLQKQTKSPREIKASKEAIRHARRDLEELAVKIKDPVLGHADGRYPAYIILTAKKGLEQQYGQDQLAHFMQVLELLERSTKQLPGWTAHTLYLDDPLCTDNFDLPPALPGDAWSIKKLLADLDTSLGHRGERIGAILIVGSEQVVPFHLLPNPLDDFDQHVHSDNPYASEDENYFVPVWPIGRLPGSAGSDPQPLLKQLNHVLTNREKELLSRPQTAGFAAFLRQLIARLFGRDDHSNLGYSAEVWRRASHAVYRPIGKPHRLIVSPPVTAGRIPAVAAHESPLAYFNLHGLEDAPEWYGQRDPVEGQDGPDYPIALRPQDIRNSGSAPKVVFSEACFGANVVNKSVEQAICLKFLDSGTKALVGSTCTSYGSIAAPLIAADLLAQAFWNFLQDGHPAGEALRRAKIHLAKEMSRRQGYLDGEDQKTLISFVLYGDPLTTANGQRAGNYSRHTLPQTVNPARIKAVCDKVDPGHQTEIPDEVIRQVKGVVKQYLPGMSDASMVLAHEHIDCQGHNCPIPHTHNPPIMEQLPDRQVVTLSKQVSKGSLTHTRHARITFDAQGKVSKLAVSR